MGRLEAAFNTERAMALMAGDCITTCVAQRDYPGSAKISQNVTMRRPVPDALARPSAAYPLRNSSMTGTATGGFWTGTSRVSVSSPSSG